MAKYRITLVKVQLEDVKESEYQELYNNETFKELRAKDPEVRQYGYVQKIETKEKATTIYEQTVEKDDFDMKKVIDAFNQ